MCSHSHHIHSSFSFWIYFGNIPKPAFQMASEEELINMTARREVLRSFSLSETEMSVKQNLQCASAHHDSLMCQWVAVEDAPEMARLLDAEMHSVE